MTKASGVIDGLIGRTIGTVPSLDPRPHARFESADASPWVAQPGWEEPYGWTEVDLTATGGQGPNPVARLADEPVESALEAPARREAASLPRATEAGDPGDPRDTADGRPLALPEMRSDPSGEAPLAESLVGADRLGDGPVADGSPGQARFVDHDSATRVDEGSGRQRSVEHLFGSLPSVKPIRAGRGVAKQDTAEPDRLEADPAGHRATEPTVLRRSAADPDARPRPELTSTAAEADRWAASEWRVVPPASDQSTPALAAEAVPDQGDQPRTRLADSGEQTVTSLPPGPDASAPRDSTAPTRAHVGPRSPVVEVLTTRSPAERGTWLQDLPDPLRTAPAAAATAYPQTRDDERGATEEAAPHIVAAAQDARRTTADRPLSTVHRGGPAPHSDSLPPPEAHIETTGRPEPGSPSAGEPRVTVHIGRVVVAAPPSPPARASQPPPLPLPPLPAWPSTEPGSQALSLADYLSRREHPSP